MITTEKTFEVLEGYPLARIGRPQDLLFFDIETTGFSGDRDQVYLIGCVRPLSEGRWQLTQWFAETKEAETDVLTAFFTCLREFRVLVHFNGEGFDIPFLLKRCEKLGLPHDFSGVESFDIFRRIRPFKKFLGMESMKQKSVEQFLGIAREDKYNGGQLIEIYHDYLRSHSPMLYSLLMLHNEDDLKGMPSILPILNYPDFFVQEFTLSGQELLSGRNPLGEDRHMLRLYCENASVRLPVPVSCDQAPAALTAEGFGFSLTIDLYEGELKHYYENYKDYYYLIYEDNAIHKSIGEYVSKEARVPAKKDTCYTRRSGCFLPQVTPVWEPVLKKGRKDRLCYCELTSAGFSDAAALQRYLRQFFSWLGIPG